MTHAQHGARLLLAAVVLAACADANRAAGPPEEPSFQIVIESALPVAMQCQNIQLTARTIPETDDERFLWRTSQPLVATIDSQGLLSARQPGSVTVTAKWAADTTRAATLTLIVTAARSLPVVGLTTYYPGTEQVMPAAGLHGVVDVAVAFSSSVGEEVRLLLGNAVIWSEPVQYVECPVVSRRTVPLDTRLFANGTYLLEVLALRSTAGPFVRATQQVTIAN